MAKISKLESKVNSFFKLYDETFNAHHSHMINDYSKLYVSDTNYHLTVDFSNYVIRNDLIYNRVSIRVRKTGDVIRSFVFYFYTSSLIVEFFRTFIKSLPYDDLNIEEVYYGQIIY